MSNANTLLKFFFSIDSFVKSGKDVITIPLKSSLAVKKGELDSVAQKMQLNSINEIPIRNISVVYNKFINNLDTLEQILDRRDCRILVYCLNYSEASNKTIFSQLDILNKALTFLDKEKIWKDSLLIGLLSCLLELWHDKNEESKKALSNFINKKFNLYTGQRKPLVHLKNNIEFFDIEKGDVILGKYLSRNNIDIQEVTNFLGVNHLWLSKAYFSEVIRQYFDAGSNLKQVEVMKIILSKHPVKSTRLQVISSLIIKTNDNNWDELVESVKKIAFEFIGDPEVNSLWSPFKGATFAQCERIEKAQSILCDWLAKQFIEVFFKIAIDCYRRRNFWIDIAAKNRVSFKMFGSLVTKAKLSKDKRISDYIDNRYTVVTAGGDVSAFVLFVNNHVLIEFSETGYAFRAYLKNTISSSNLFTGVRSINDLRKGNVSNLVTRQSRDISNMKTEGKLSHMDGDLSWEEVFIYWLEHIADINV